MHAADHTWHTRLPLRAEPVTEHAEVSWSHQPTFDFAVVLTQRYYSAVAGHFPLPETELVRELSVLVQQLDFLLKSTHLLCERYWNLENGRPETWPAIQHVAFVIDVYATSFYYLGHRAQSILRGSSVKLPHLSGYEMAAGVRDVRNHIIEHPKSKNVVSVSGTSIHSEWGPKVRPNRDGTPLDDSGKGWMFVDAAELIQQIQDAVQSAYGKLQDKDQG